MPRATIGGQPIRYREEGEGRPAVLLLHGAGGGSGQFLELAHLIARGGRRVVALDLPGHGGSPPFALPPPPEELLEAYRDVVADFAEVIGLGRFVLVGHSMGGAVAQHVALAYGDRLEGLVLLATAARLKVAPPLLQAIRQQFAQLPTLLAAVGYSPASDRGQVQRWAEGQILAPQETVLADFLACAAFDLRERAGEIRCPTSVISAADDMLTPPKLQQQLAGLIDGASLKTLSRAGHFLFFERAGEVARSILEHGCLRPVDGHGQQV